MSKGFGVKIIVKCMKIAHLTIDAVFIDSAYEQFEAATNCYNDYYIVSLTGSVKRIKKANIKVVLKSEYQKTDFIKKLLSYDIIIFHSLTPFHLKLIKLLSKFKVKPRLIWIGMGYDYYDIISQDKKSLYLDKTLDLIKKNKPKSGSLTRIRNFLRHCYYPNKKSVISSLDFFAPVVPSEYEVVKKAFLKEKVGDFPAFVSWNYSTSSVELLSKDDGFKKRDRVNILLGNSAIETNNHLEAIDLLSEIKKNISIDKVVCPLSYGSIEYASIVKEYGSRGIGENFFPLDTFMEYNEYSKILNECTVFVMNSKRQQAGGNIVAMLLKGATVFLREENPFFHLFRSNGLKIFSIQELECNHNLINYRVPHDDVVTCQEFFENYYRNRSSKTHELIHGCKKI